MSDVDSEGYNSVSAVIRMTGKTAVKAAATSVPRTCVLTPRTNPPPPPSAAWPPQPRTKSAIVGGNHQRPRRR